MQEPNLKNVDPRLIARAAEYIGASTGDVINTLQSPMPFGIPGRRGHGVPPVAPMASPVAMPGAPGPGGYMRYREMTIDEMLLENRVVFLVGEINHVSAANVYMKMLYLQSIKKDQDINLYINSPGGAVVDTLAVYDVMRFLSCEVATYCIGECASGGAVLFMAGQKGKRYILPHAKVMIHQPYGGVYGQAADIEIQAEEILKTKETLVSVMAKCTGQPRERVREDSERDRFFDARQAMEYGICDEILGEETSTAQAAAAADASKPK